MIEVLDLVTMTEERRWHQPVMVAELVEAVRPQPGAIIVDATVGTAGHSLALLPHLLPDGRLIAIDRDADALARAKARLIEFESHVTWLHANFRHLPERLQQLGVPQVDGVVVDLGMSSLQIETAERGFSFQQEGALDMRMDRTQAFMAETLIHDSPVDELARIFQMLGEERFAGRIAAAIGRARRLQPITTTTQLARIVCAAVPPQARRGRLHPATRVFQALRIAVNDELGALTACLEALPALLKPRGRVVILTFHSLEDRLVKHAFLRGAREGWWQRLTTKPLRPSVEEVRRNPRARSAKLRAVERL